MNDESDAAFELKTATGGRECRAIMRLPSHVSFCTLIMGTWPVFENDTLMGVAGVVDEQLSFREPAVSELVTLGSRCNDEPT